MSTSGILNFLRRSLGMPALVGSADFVMSYPPEVVDLIKRHKVNHMMVCQDPPTDADYQRVRMNGIVRFTKEVDGTHYIGSKGDRIVESIRCHSIDDFMSSLPEKVREMAMEYKATSVKMGVGPPDTGDYRDMRRTGDIVFTIEVDDVYYTGIRGRK
ncbi:MAG: hypothetical protein MPK62_01640 [Alphaproteobacteria bacterium]|nr:hypothetical protein [Alphaproteobacteria bacterium]MDA8029837.1 hypothetical protein [Alphaproteobacteria bacterium]